MKKLNELFDKVFVINCSHRKDRLLKLKENFQLPGVVDFSDVEIFNAINGFKMKLPPYWRRGRGTWGCYQSHCSLIQNILNSDVDYRSVLILEDDVFFNMSSLVEINYLVKHLPHDWDQFYLGGQHRSLPERTDNPLILRAKSVNRTHAYALNSRVLKDFYAHITNVPEFAERGTHIDHHLQRAHESGMWNTYCPLKWVAGQTSGDSNISHSRRSDGSWESATPNRRYWHPNNPNEGIDANKAEAYYLGDEAPIKTP